MKYMFPAALAALAIVGLGLVASASAVDRGGVPRRWAPPTGAWHAGYYDPSWGLPCPLVVPPTARMETHWGWGVGNTRITPLFFQFHRDYPGPLSYDPRTFMPVPPWPSDTDQFGNYSIRGPW
jgi:hypothetical protein